MSGFRDEDNRVEKSTLIDLALHLHHQTEAAWLLSDTGIRADAKWLPFSRRAWNRPLRKHLDHARMDRDRPRVGVSANPVHLPEREGATAGSSARRIDSTSCSALSAELIGSAAPRRV